MAGGGKSSTSTSAVTIPPEVLARYNSVNATAQNVAQTPFQPYSSNPSDFVAPVNSTQQQGINQIAGSANAAQPFFGAAAGLTAAGAGPANLGGLNTNQYMSPFMGDVYGQALAGQQLQNQQQQSNLAGQAVTAGAFGGDRANTAQANLAYQQNLANNQTNANLLNTGYQNAQNVATQQQGAQLAAQQANLARLTGAGGQLAGIGTAAQTAAQQGGQNTLAAGTVPQQTQQAGLTALYNQFLQQQAYPFQTAQFLANIAEGTGALSGSTTTQTQPSSFFSDRRLKHDIKKIGKTDDGLPIYKFKYKGDPSEQTHVGFMAQDVEKVHPEAVGESHGYKTVDYDKATRHARYAGGLIPHHMGGEVNEGHMGEEYARGGYALNGAVVDASDMAAIMAAQQHMYAPFSESGMGITGTPGAGKGIVPAANLPVPKLVTANPHFTQQPTGMQQIQNAENAGNMVSGLYYGGKKGLLGAPASTYTQDGKTYQQAASTGLMGAGGNYDPNKGWLGPSDTPAAAAPAPATDVMTPDNNPATDGVYARGGLVGYANGGLPYDDSDPNKLDIPNDAPTAKLTPADPPKQSQDNTLGNIAQIAGMAAMFMSQGGLARAHRAGGGPLDYAEPTNSSADTSDLDPMFADRIQDLQQDAGDEGIPSKLISGYRDTANQSELYNKYLAGGNLAAPPGHSLHEAGLAADVQAVNPDQQDALIAMAKEPWRGLKAGADFGDPSHFQMAGAKPGLGGAINAYAENALSAANAPASRAIVDAENGSDGSEDSGLLSGLGKAAGSAGDWFGKNQNWILPVLTGLGTMASSPSRYLGSAILQGLGGGAQAYNNQQLQQSEIAKNTLGLMQQRFTPTTYRDGNGDVRLAYFDQISGKIVSPEQRAAIAGNATSPTAILQPVHTSVDLGGPQPTVQQASSTSGAPAKAVQQASSTDAPRPEDEIYSRVDSLPQIKSMKTSADNYDSQADQLLRQAQVLTGTGPQGEAAAARLTAQASQSRALAQQYRTNMMTQREQLAAPAIEQLKETNKKNIERKFSPETTPSGSEYMPDPNKPFGGLSSAPFGGLSSAPTSAGHPVPEERMTIDPKTAEPQTVSPKPPPGGGFPVPQLPAGAKPTKIGEPAKELAKTDSEFNKTMLGNAPVVAQGIERLRALGQAYKTFESGAGQDKMYALAAYASAYGRPDIAQMALGGGKLSTAAYEWVKKEGVNLTLNTLSAQNPRFAQSEFKALAADGVPNTINRPEANQRLVAEGLGTLLQQQKFQDDWTKRGKADGWESPSAYYQQWSSANPLDGFISSAQRQIGNFRGSTLPPTKEWVEGGTYVAPKNPSPELKKQLDVMGVQPNQVFRYKGRNSPVEPLKDEDALKAYGRQ